MTPLDALLEALTVERFTHLPETHREHGDGPTAQWAEATEAAAWARLHELRTAAEEDVA